MPRVRTLLAGLASRQRRREETASPEGERLAEVRKKLAEKNRRLKRLREQLEVKDEEVLRLQEALAARDAGERTGGIDPANIVWIFGTARTGSTWLSEMLAESKGCATWNEPFVGTLFAPTFYRLDWQLVGGRRESILSPRYAPTWLKSVRSLILDGVEARFTAVSRESCLIVKDPHGSVGAPIVMKAIPESRMIVLVRDPRDVAASILDGSREGGWRERDWERTDGDPDSLVRVRAELYLKSVGNAWQAYKAHTGRKVLVRYEDLRADAQGEMKRLCSALGMEVDEMELARVAERHSWENIPEDRKGEGKFYRKATPGGWKEDLTPEQAATVESITAPLLDEFYPEWKGETDSVDSEAALDGEGLAGENERPKKDGERRV